MKTNFYFIFLNGIVITITVKMISECFCEFLYFQRRKSAFYNLVCVWECSFIHSCIFSWFFFLSLSLSLSPTPNFFFIMHLIRLVILIRQLNQNLLEVLQHKVVFKFHLSNLIFKKKSPRNGIIQSSLLSLGSWALARRIAWNSLTLANIHRKC